MSSLSGVWWEASWRACGHIFVQHHQECREAVILASEEWAFIAVWLFKDHLYARNVRGPFHSKYFWSFVLVEVILSLMGWCHLLMMMSPRAFTGLGALVGGGRPRLRGRSLCCISSWALVWLFLKWANPLSTLFLMWWRVLGQHANMVQKRIEAALFYSVTFACFELSLLLAYSLK